MMIRKSKGRQKIEMVKMVNDSNLQVTFSKRRAGLFKKASELCTLCGVDVVIVVFSPGKKAFSFGHPNVDDLVDRFFSRSPPPQSSTTTSTMLLLEAHRNASVHDLNMQLTQVQNQLEAEKKLGDELNRERKYYKNQCWWLAPIEELTSTQLQQLKVSLEDLKKTVTKQAEKLLLQSHNSQHFVASNSNLPFELKPQVNVGFNGNPNMNIMLPPPPPPLPSQLQAPPLPPPQFQAPPSLPPLSLGFNLGFGHGFY